MIQKQRQTRETSRFRNGVKPFSESVWMFHCSHENSSSLWTTQNPIILNLHRALQVGMKWIGVTWQAKWKSRGKTIISHENFTKLLSRNMATGGVAILS